MIHIFEDKKPTLEEAQSLVDGYVEMVRSPVHGDIQILVIVGDAVVLKGDARWD